MNDPMKAHRELREHHVRLLVDFIKVELTTARTMAKVVETELHANNLARAREALKKARMAHHEVVKKLSETSLSDDDRRMLEAQGREVEDVLDHLALPDESPSD